MDYNFTWSEFLKKSENALIENEKGLSNAEQNTASVFEKKPADSSLRRILKFAETYDSIYSDQVGYIELNLN